MLCVLDEFTRECLAIRVARRLSSIDVIEMLAELCLEHGVPDHVRSDLGPEFIAMAVREWIAAVGAKTAFIERASPWENGYVESFNGKLRDELLNAEIFDSLAEARIIIEAWRRHYNTVRPHSALPTARRHRASCSGRRRQTRHGSRRRPLHPWHRTRTYTNLATGPDLGGRSLLKPRFLRTFLFDQ
jgi:integrase-like protein